MSHKAGFVSIIGSPNVGKSTLMNALIGQKMSIITPKAQTTRHRIFGILNSDNAQIVYSDTPGIVEASYKLHETMMMAVESALEDADIFLFVTDIYEKQNLHPQVVERIKSSGLPVLVLINKIDKLKNQEFLVKMVEFWHQTFPAAEILPISAKEKVNTNFVLEKILNWLPEHPAYFEKGFLSDRTTRFFVSEIIREKILLLYEKEIPYCSEVLIESYEESEKLVRIGAQIIVARESQKAILLGHKGEKIRELGQQARLDIEAFIEQKVFLEMHIKVDKDWRNDERKLRKYGYLLS